MQEQNKNLDDMYAKGQLQGICDHLTEFADRHRGEVFKVAGSQEPKALIEGLKTLIHQRGSIHLPSEMADQIREINNEIWYRGEKGDFDRSKIKEEWAMKYAGAWRSWRVKEILFVCDKISDRLLGILNTKSKSMA